MLLPVLRHLFTPHHTNNHRPHLLHPQGLAILVAIFLFSQASLKLLAQVKGNVLGFASSITPESVLSLTNARRSEIGLSPLTLNSQLTQAALTKAADMFAQDYWAHNNPTGREPWDFIKDSGYRYRYAGENLGRDFGDTQSLVDAWMASSTHRDNILNARYQETGIAVVNGTLQGVETTLVVHLFGTPPATQPLISGIHTPVQAQQIPVPSPSPSPVISSPPSQPQPPLTPTSLISTPDALQPLSPLLLEKVIAVSIVLLIFLVLLADTLYARHHRLIRLVGRNIAHTLFFLVILSIIILSQPGGVL